MGIVRRCETLGFQSTHPRGVRLEPLQIGAVDVVISIHAPTWGATLNSILFRSNFLFQSTHPRGVRQGDDRDDDHREKFQSTHPRGVRLL